MCQQSPFKGRLPSFSRLVPRTATVVNVVVHYLLVADLGYVERQEDWGQR